MKVSVRPKPGIKPGTMLERVELPARKFEDYRGIISDSLYSDVLDLGRRLAGKRILFLSATHSGGGVAELLKPEVALLQDLGIAAEWWTLKAPKSFFEITKQIHNGLQGDRINLKPSQWDAYEDFNHRLGSHLAAGSWDFIVVHDPQPAAVAKLIPDRGAARWIWRCHIDTKHANPHYLRRFIPYWNEYDGSVFTMAKFVPEGYMPKHLAVIPVAIDPLNAKNTPMTKAAAAEIVAGFGVDVKKPLVTQVSRFDPWKDPLGVVEAWKLAKEQLPDLQLALVGDMAADDPQGRVILRGVEAVSVGQPDLFVIAGRADDRAVQAFQTHSNVILQKSLREGFGLTVAEALWAKTPVIGGAVGGIPLQVIEGKSGYLVTNSQAAAARMVQLVRDPDRAKSMGEYGHELVKQKFLLPRMIRDDLLFFLEVAR